MSRWSTQSFHFVKEEIFIVLPARKEKSSWPKQQARPRMRKKQREQQRGAQAMAP